LDAMGSDCPEIYAMTCTHALIIHKDGSCFCPRPGCLEGGILKAVLRHRTVVSCQAVLALRCPVCDRETSEIDTQMPRSATSTSPAQTPALCSGTAVAHENGSVQCSHVGCRPGLDVGQWLAGHSDIRSCRSLNDPCPLCSVPNDSWAILE